MYIIYGKQSCPACDEAKRVLDQHGKQYRYLEWNVDYTQQEFIENTSGLSFPQIVYVSDDTRQVFTMKELYRHLFGV